MLPPKPIDPPPDPLWTGQAHAEMPLPPAIALNAAMRLLAPTAADPPAAGIGVGTVVHSARWLREQAAACCAAAESLADSLDGALTVAMDESMAYAPGCDPEALRGDCRARALEAAGLAGLAADPDWEVAMLLRVSEVLDRCGEHRESIAIQTRALTLISCDDEARPTVWPDDGKLGILPQAPS
jgi:hypothetical protein